jgi:hypothetical protein
MSAFCGWKNDRTRLCWGADLQRGKSSNLLKLSLSFSCLKVASLFKLKALCYFEFSKWF